MNKVWTRFRTQDGKLLYRRMAEDEATVIANEHQWMPKVVETELGETLDRLVGFDDRWVAISEMLTADPFPVHLG